MKKNILLKILAATAAATATINGRSYSGNNIQINGDNVVIDGVVQEGTLTGPISVTINGDVDSIETMSGDVSTTGDVSGNIETASGDIACGNVGGKVETMSGDVECGNITGKVETMSGDILHR